MSTLNDFLSHPIETLERALHIRKQIAQLEKMLKEVMSPEPMSKSEIRAIGGSKPRGKRKRSAATRAKMAAAQQARWAKSKGLESATLAGPVEIASTAKTKKKGGMSAAGRARIAAAQKARWAKVKAGKSVPSTAAPVARKKKRRLSPEGRARIIAATKARWAREKMAK